jgi:hypothetical protein
MGPASLRTGKALTAIFTFPVMPAKLGFGWEMKTEASIFEFLRSWDLRVSSLQNKNRQVIYFVVLFAQEIRNGFLPDTKDPCTSGVFCQNLFNPQPNLEVAKTVIGTFMRVPKAAHNVAYSKIFHPWFY